MTDVIEPLLSESTSDDRAKKCVFRSSRNANYIDIDLSSALEDAVLQLRKEVPLELVVRMFQKLVCSLDSSVTSS